MRTKAFAYTRVSSTGQDRGHGPKRQLDAITRFAKRRFEIVEVFHDSHTGTEADRPAFTAMVAALKSNGTKTVIIESLDRLARDLAVQMALLAVLQQEGIALFSATTGQNITEDVRDDPMREAMVLVQGVFAQVDKKLLVRKLKKARDEKREDQGWCEGQRPFGEKDGEDKVVALVKKMHAADPLTGRPRNSLAEIAAELDRRGVKPRRGDKWSRTSVWKILERLQPSRAK